MKALIYTNNNIELVEKPYPQILNSRDAIVKVALSSICTSDLHIKHGFVPFVRDGVILGHEFVGEVVELGSELKNLRAGDRVSANCETFCGECYFCKRGFINNCEHGGWELGCKIDGCQAEYVRVPFADTGLTKIPDSLSYENALFVGDILSSGYFGAEMLGEAETVAVIGAGPVGLCAMMSAKVLGAKKIIAIDINSSRLNIAREQKLADYVFNPLECDIEQEIKNLTDNHGADGVIEAAGGENTFELAWKIARPNSVVALVAMYENNQVLPLPEMYGKNLIFKTGGVDAVHCKKLLDFISEGKMNTDFLITHSFDFKDIIRAYDFFEKDSCLKISIRY
ncbi:MAG: alcohol dehydrogenase [Candidatus Gastranaerophilales bacterium]|nr:alcohol dehydrogenase [Candidatus Gastranaerophilales bacterium]MCM1072729.1 alcohol dehydrogenase [Bacteroides sp.]